MGLAGLGLDVTLVHRLSRRLFLDDDVSVFETLFKVAQ